jgi:DNA-binding CsgD family transcriptional regulator/PAS domain-containing protein
MGKKTIIICYVIATIAMVFLTLWQWLAPSKATPQAIEGVLNLESWNPEQIPAVALNGQWEFFPGQLSATDLRGRAAWRTVPDLWTGVEAAGLSGQGAGTYRLTVILPEKTAPLALRWRTISTAATFSVDGQLLASVGRPDLEAVKDRPQYRPQVVPFSPAGREFVLTVQVSNHEYRSGGLWRALELGSATSLEQQRIADMVVTFVFAGAMLAIALNALFYYSFRQQKLGYLFFSLFTVTIGLRYLVTGDYTILSIFSGLGYDALIRIENATISLLFITFILFFMWFLDGPRRFLAILLGPELVYLALAPVAPILILSRCLLPLIFLMILQLGLFTVRAWLPAWREGKSASRTILAGLLFLVTAGIHDALVTLSRYVLVSFLPWAFLIFVFLLAAMMAGHFNSDQRRLETLTADLSKLLLDRFTGAVLFTDNQGIIIRASEAAVHILGDNIENQPLTQGLKGCSDFDAQWSAMARDLQPKNELSGYLGSGRYKINMLPYQSTSNELIGAIVRIVPESTLDESAMINKFTARERKVAELICKGLDTKQIAEALFISQATVKTHLHKLYTKTGTTGKADLVRVLLSSV